MSRSIHTTRKTLREIAKKEFASEAALDTALEATRRDLKRKRRIKRQVAEERRRPAPPLAGTDSATIPIEVHHAGPYVHHSASVEDLRAILRLLPTAATDGVTSIKLILAKEFMDEEYADEHEARDPFTGRLSCNTLPGVYSGPCLGTYSRASGQIRLHAYVYDPMQLPLTRRGCELYLRLRALCTFVHELAHHHDVVNRVRRGRWLTDRTEHAEWYAEKMEHTWTRQFVIPYLQATYAPDVKALLDDVEHFGGVRLPLEFFAGDSRRTLRNGMTRFAFTTDGAFESWVAKLPACQNLAASRVAFAWELHFADHYQTCLQVLARVLAEEPDLIAALICQGDTLVHLRRHDEALALAQRVLIREPTNSHAWEICGDVCEDRQDWTGLLVNCDCWLAQVPIDSDSRFGAFQHRAVAYCGLGDTPNMELWIAAWATFGKRKRNPDSIRKWVFRRAGKKLPK